MTSTMTRRLTAEFIGTFWLVLVGCGAAIFAASFPDDANASGIGLFGVATAFGLAVLTMAYAFGHLSGGHFNPAVSLGLMLAKRLPAKDFIPYVVTQVLAGTVAAAVLFAVASGRAGFDAPSSGFAANGYGEHSPGGYSMTAVLVMEAVMTAFFLLVILGATDRRAPQGFAPIAIGLALMAIHLVSIPISNTSVNPARSTGQALFVGGWALSQLWMFWVAPLLGAAVAGLSYRMLTGDTGTTPVAREGQPVEKAESDAHDAMVDLTLSETPETVIRGGD